MHHRGPLASRLRRTRASPLAAARATTNAGSPHRAGHATRASVRPKERWLLEAAQYRWTFAATARAKAPKATAMAECNAVLRGETQSEVLVANESRERDGADNP